MIKAVVLGGAENVWTDFQAAGRLADFDLVIAINHAFVAYPGEIDHAVSFHALLFPHWLEQRRAAGFPDPRQFWTVEGVRHHPAMEFRTVSAIGGSSGMVGAQVGMQVADKVVLCGIPLEPKLAHFDRAGDWRDAVCHRDAWATQAAELRRKVRSMSGWTADLLGTPDRSWLDSADPEA